MQWQCNWLAMFALSVLSASPCSGRQQLTTACGLSEPAQRITDVDLSCVEGHGYVLQLMAAMRITGVVL
jgi:hypothetical protein